MRAIAFYMNLSQLIYPFHKTPTNQVLYVPNWTNELVWSYVQFGGLDGGHCNPLQSHQVHTIGSPSVFHLYGIPTT